MYDGRLDRRKQWDLLHTRHLRRIEPRLCDGGEALLIEDEVAAERRVDDLEHVHDNGAGGDGPVTDEYVVHDVHLWLDFFSVAAKIRLCALVGLGGCFPVLEAEVGNDFDDEVQHHGQGDGDDVVVVWKCVVFLQPVTRISGVSLPKSRVDNRVERKL